jgi:hypothetical protein
MKVLTNTFEAILGVAVLILAPLILLVFWNCFSESAFLHGCNSAPLPSHFGSQFSRPPLGR